jgi:hypothetical protein
MRKVCRTKLTTIHGKRVVCLVIFNVINPTNMIIVKLLDYQNVMLSGYLSKYEVISTV